MTAAAAYAICAVRDIPNRRVKGFHLLRVGEDGRPVPWHIFIVRWDRKLHGYVNLCPHQATHLDWERDHFLDPYSSNIICGKHGALFDVASGACIEGPCLGGALEPVRLVVLDGDICVAGVALVEDDTSTSG